MSHADESGSCVFMVRLVLKEFELVVCSWARPADSCAASPPLVTVDNRAVDVGQHGGQKSEPGQVRSDYFWCRLGSVYF